MPLEVTTITEQRDPSEGLFVPGGLDVHALAGPKHTGQLDDTQVPASAVMRWLSLVEESGQRRVLVFQRLDLNR